MDRWENSRSAVDDFSSIVTSTLTAGCADCPMKIAYVLSTLIDISTTGSKVEIITLESSFAVTPVVQDRLGHTIIV